MWQRDVFDLILAIKAENNSSNVWSGEILKANSRARSEVHEQPPLLPWELGRCFLQSPIDGVWRATAPFYHEKSGYSVNRMDKDLIQVKKSSPLVICQVSKHDICTRGWTFKHIISNFLCNLWMELSLQYLIWKLGMSPFICHMVAWFAPTGCRVTDQNVKGDR